MLTVETKLARWRVFYGELCEALQWRTRRGGRGTGGPAGATSVQEQHGSRLASDLTPRHFGTCDRSGKPPAEPDCVTPRRMPLRAWP